MILDYSIHYYEHCYLQSVTVGYHKVLLTVLSFAQKGRDLYEDVCCFYFLVLKAKPCDN